MDIYPGVLNCPGSSNFINQKTMKKLNLGKLKLASEEVLQRSQLASIYGGTAIGAFSTGSCTLTCSGQGGQHNVNSCHPDTIKNVCPGGSNPLTCSGPSSVCDPD